MRTTWAGPIPASTNILALTVPARAMATIGAAWLRSPKGFGSGNGPPGAVAVGGSAVWAWLPGADGRERALQRRQRV